MTSPAPSLLIGSDALGWQDFPTAQLGVRTKQMPGGDGSLEFTIPGDFARKHRNVLVPESVVKLTVDGEVDFGGRLSCDPLRHRIGCQDTVELVATGPWGMAARDSRHAYLGVDTDLDRWQQYRGVNEFSGRYTASKEGYLELRANSDRSYGADTACRFYYWVHDGLAPQAYGVSGMDGAFSGIAFEYKLRLPTTRWKCGIVAGDSPLDAMAGMFVWGPYDGTAAPLIVDWTAAHADIDTIPTLGKTCLMLVLYTDAGTGSPDPDPYILLRKVRPVGRWIGVGSPDYSPSLADILADCAEALDVTTTRIAGLTTEPDEFVARYPVSVAAVIEQATLLEAAPVEAYFDHDGAGFRFTANTRPASVNLARNRLWSVTDYDVRKLRHDWETTPEQVEVLYAVKDHATLPDGTARAARYPASTTATFPLTETVDITGDPPMTAAVAAQYAEMIYRARQDSLYTGDVPLAQTALTSTGQDVPTVKLRQGDRIGVPSLLDVDSAGLYVQKVAYDYRTQRCVATVGEPWDPLGFRPRTGSRPAQGTGGRGGATGGPGRRTPYLRRSGVA